MTTFTLLAFGLCSLTSSQILLPSNAVENEFPSFNKFSESFAEPECKFGYLQTPPDCNVISKPRNQNQASFSTCVLTETDLQHLVDLVTDALTAATSPPSQTRFGATQKCVQNCTLERSNVQPLRTKLTWKEGPCQELFKTIETLLRRLTQSILPLVPLRLAIIDPNEYCAFVGEMEEKMLSLRTILCNLELSTSQNLTVLREKLWEQEKCYIYHWTCAMGEVDELVASLRAQRLPGLISLLRAGRLTDLTAELNFLNDRSLIAPLISGSYNAATMEYISQFVDLLSDDRLSYQRYVTYNATLFAMLAVGNQQSNVVLLLKRMLDTDTAQQMKGMYFLKAVVDRAATSLLNGWVESIHLNTFSTIIEFGSPPVENRAGLSFLHILPELMGKVFKRDESNIVPIIRFVTALRWNRHKDVALTELQKLFVKTGHQIQLALLVKDTLNGNLTGPDMQFFHNVSNSLCALQDTFPVAVQNVVFGTNCRISTYEGQFLSLGSFSHGQDFIQRPTNINGGNNEWEFEPVYSKSRGEYIFRIRNTMDEYLMADFFWTTNGNGATATSTLEPCGDERFYGWQINDVDISDPSRIQVYHLGRMLYLNENVLSVSNLRGVSLVCSINTCQK